MAHDRVDHDVGLAPRRVDRAVAAGDRAPAATRARAAPSRSASRAPPGWCRAVVDEATPGRRRSRPAGRANGATSARSASGSQQRVRVGERDELAARALDGRVLRADLAAARQLEHDVGAGLAGALRRSRRASRRRRRSPPAARAGSRARAAFATFSAITASSSWAATISETDGSLASPPPRRPLRATAAAARAPPAAARSRAACRRSARRRARRRREGEHGGGIWRQRPSAVADAVPRSMRSSRELLITRNARSMARRIAVETSSSLRGCLRRITRDVRARATGAALSAPRACGRARGGARRSRPRSTARPRRRGRRSASALAGGGVGEQRGERGVERRRVAGRDELGGAGRGDLGEAADVAQQQRLAERQRGEQHARLVDLAVGQHDEVGAAEERRAARRRRRSAARSARPAARRARSGATSIRGIPTIHSSAPSMPAPGLAAARRSPCRGAAGRRTARPGLDTAASSGGQRPCAGQRGEVRRTRRAGSRAPAPASIPELVAQPRRAVLGVHDDRVDALVQPPLRAQLTRRAARAAARRGRSARAGTRRGQQVHGRAAAPSATGSARRRPPRARRR